MVTVDEQLLDSGGYDRSFLKGKKVGLCHGCFDILHFGHIKHFEEAKSLVDVLIVSITSDEFVGKGSGRPFFDQELRVGVLEAVKFIDLVAINRFDDAQHIINLFRPDLYIKGPDYRNNKTASLLAEINAVENIGGNVFFTSGIKYSSTELFKTLYSKL